MDLHPYDIECHDITRHDNKTKQTTLFQNRCHFFTSKVFFSFHFFKFVIHKRNVPNLARGQALVTLALALTNVVAFNLTFDIYICAQLC
jgi:hypothetical protein